VVGDRVSLLLDGAAFATPIDRVLTSGDISTNSITLTIGNTASWGADGNKTLTAQITDSAGNAGNASSALTLALDTVAPGAPTNSLTIAAAANGISASEKTANVAVLVNLSGTNAAAGDTVSLLIGNAAFATPVDYTLTAGDITAGNATLTIPNAAGWGADGTKALSARLIDAAGNVGIAGGDISVVLDTTAPTAASTTPIQIVDTDTNAVYSATDIIKLFFSEAVAVASIGSPSLGGSGSPSLGTSAAPAAVGAAGGFATEFDITLAGAVSLAAGQTITLVGIDAAGNQASVIWTLP
jgi:hypothetical protein